MSRAERHYGEDKLGFNKIFWSDFFLFILDGGGVSNIPLDVSLVCGGTGNVHNPPPGNLHLLLHEGQQNLPFVCSRVISGLFLDGIFVSKFLALYISYKSYILMT